MRIFIAIIIGIIGGFVVGIALSSFLGIFGMLLLDKPLGIKYLPYITAFLCAIIVPIIDQKVKVH